jgi:hypothetical protein
MATRGYEHVKASDLAQHMGKAKPSKYRNTKTVVDGITFDSKKEAQRYHELKLLEKCGEITHLVLQPKFDLYAAKPLESGWRDIAYVGGYVADFQYRDQRAGGYTVVEDVKSPATRTAVYMLKKKIAEACHGIQIREIR